MCILFANGLYHPYAKIDQYEQHNKQAGPKQKPWAIIMTGRYHTVGRYGPHTRLFPVVNILQGVDRQLPGRTAHTIGKIAEIISGPRGLWIATQDKVSHPSLQ